MTTTLPRAATSPELALIRTDNQSHDWFLTIPIPSVIYSARLASVPTTTDKCASITYSSGAGVGGKTYADILPDQTLLIGSTPLGYDLGICRIRKLTGIGATSGTFAIGETSEVNWAAVVSGGLYLTVIDDFDLCPRHPKIAPDGVTLLMDYDLYISAGADNENIASGHLPIPIMGQDRVLWLRGTTASVTIYDLASSWVIDGTITGYTTVCAGASATSGLNTSTPTFTFNAVGDYRWDLTVTASNGKTYVGHRFIYVRTEETCATQFTLDTPPSGNNDQGGYSFSVTLYDEATRALVRDRALVILHPKSYYGNTQTEVGFNTGSESVYIGRIAKETNHWGADGQWSSVTLEIQGPHYWLGKMTAFGGGVKEVPTESDILDWSMFTMLRADKMLYTFACFYTTMARCMDVYPCGNTTRVHRFQEPSEYIWDQIKNMFFNTIRAQATCDRVGRLFLQIDQQLLLDKSSIPVVMEITKEDWYTDTPGSGIDFDRDTVAEAGRIVGSGAVWNGTLTAQFADSPGNVPKQYGAASPVDRLALDGVQANTNTLIGLFAAVKNNPYKKIPIRLASLHGLFDIAPHMRATLAIAAADTPRSIAETLTLIPRSIGVVAGDNPGVYYQEIEFEAEVVPALAVTGDTPQTPPSPPVVPIPPPVVPIPPIVPVPTNAKECWFPSTHKIYYSVDFSFSGASEPSYYEVAALPDTCTSITFADGALDGSFIALLGQDSDTNDDSLWVCTNPKAASPTWTRLLKYGDDIISGYTVEIQSTWQGGLGNILCRNSTLLIKAGGISGGSRKDFYGEYTLVGGAITWTDIGTRGKNNEAINYRRFVKPYSGGTYALYATTAPTTVITSWLQPDGFGASLTEMWQNLIGTNIYGEQSCGALVGGVRPRFIRNLVLGTQVYEFTEASDDTGQEYLLYVHIRGAWRGAHVYAVSHGGELILSTDGVTFTHAATWDRGWVCDSMLTGSGYLVWLLSTGPADNEFIRVYRNDGSSPIAMTGNFWSLITDVPRGQTFKNLWLVYA